MKITSNALVTPVRAEQDCVKELFEAVDITRRILSSSGSEFQTVTCALPRTRTRLSDRWFAVAGPRVWNCLPAALRAVEDYEQFRKLLKTHLFYQAAAPSDCLLLGAVYKLTLLLLFINIIIATVVCHLVVVVGLMHR